MDAVHQQHGDHAIRFHQLVVVGHAEDVGNVLIVMVNAEEDEYQRWDQQ